MDQGALLVVLGHRVVDSEPSPRSTSRLENGLVLVPLVGGVEPPEDYNLAGPLGQVGSARPQLLIHGNLADQVASSKLALSPRSSIAFIFRALALVANSLILLALTALASLFAAVFNVRILNSHAQSASPFHSRERNMDFLTRTSVAVAISPWSRCIHGDECQSRWCRRHEECRRCGALPGAGADLR